METKPSEQPEQSDATESVSQQDSEQQSQQSTSVCLSDVYIYIWWCMFHTHMTAMPNQPVRGVRLAKNDFGSVFGSVCPKTAVFGSVSVLPN